MERIKIKTRNDKYQILQAYKNNRAKRTKHGKLFIEGVVPINVAVENNIDIESVIVPDGKRISDWARNVIEKTDPKNFFYLDPELLQELSAKENHSELILIANQPIRDLESIIFNEISRILVLDRPSSPGNLGAIVRCCDAFQIDLIFISGHSVDQYDPKTISASRGTVFQVPIYNIKSNQQINAKCRTIKEKYGFRIYGTSAKGNKSLQDIKFADKSCIIIGNETTGMSDFFSEICDDTIRIDMSGIASSLNIACATAIVLHELTRNYGR